MSEETAEPGHVFAADDMMAEAIGALGWLDGYTEPPAGKPQRRMRVEEYNDDHIIVRVEAARWVTEPDKRFKITLTVEELT